MVRCEGGGSGGSIDREPSAQFQPPVRVCEDGTAHTECGVFLYGGRLMVFPACLPTLMRWGKKKNPDKTNKETPDCVTC